jgi:RimJ/RimL family protein N-acetyltransferase
MELVTERLILREFQDDDWPAILAYQRDPLYLRYSHWSDRTPAAARAFVQSFIAQQREQPRTRFQLAIALRSAEQLIGNCGIRMESPEAHEAELGYELAAEHWGHGYATEAARVILGFAFSELRLHRISSWCIADNIASVRVLEKLGFHAEGRLREKEHFKGRRWDTLLFGMLEDEWRAR